MYLVMTMISSQRETHVPSSECLPLRGCKGQKSLCHSAVGHGGCFLHQWTLTTVPASSGYGEKSAWATWNVLSEFTDELLILANAPTSIPETSLHAVERFVILLYDRTSSATDIDTARRKLIPKKKSVITVSHPQKQTWSSMWDGLPRWSHMGTSHKSSTCLASTNSPRLEEDELWPLPAILEHTTRDSKILSGTGIPRIQERLQETLQMQSSKSTLHWTMLLRWWLYLKSWQSKAASLM